MNTQMKPYFSIRLAVFFLFIALLFITEDISAKKYWIHKADITATVKKNGIISFEETRYYEFDGSYSWAKFVIDKKGFDQITNISVWDGDELLVPSDSKEPGTFRINEKKKQIEIRWYFNAKDEFKTFTVRYDIEKALVRDDEWTEFYWTFLGSRWDKKNDEVNIRLQFEEPIATYFWMDDPEFVTDEQKLTDGWKVTVVPKFRRDRIRIQTHFQSAYLEPNAITAEGRISPEQTNQNYIAKRESLLAREKQRMELAAYFYWANSIIVFLSVFSFWAFYKKHKPEFEKTPEIPQGVSYHPALLNYMVNFRNSTAGAFKATLMKLVFDGYFTLEYEGKQKKKFSSDRPLIKLKPTEKSPNELTYEFEKSLYQFLAERSARFDYLDEVFKKESSKVSKFYMKWVSESLKKVIKQQPWFVTESKTDMYWNIFVQIMFLLMASVCAYFISVIALFGIITSATMLLLSILIYHRNELGEAVYLKTKQAKKLISEFRKKQKPVPKNADWTLFLLALALDNSKEDVKYLLKSWSSEMMPNLIIDETLALTSYLFIIDDLLDMTHGAYFGTAAGGGGSGASAGAAGGGGGGGAG